MEDPKASGSAHICASVDPAETGEYILPLGSARNEWHVDGTDPGMEAFYVPRGMVMLPT